MKFKDSIRMNWYELAFDTYKKARSKAFPVSFSRLCCPTKPGLVSIVLPVHNGSLMLKESIDSILAQTYTHFELIAIDDGSTDNSGAILDEYAANDSRVHVHHQENQKLPRALSRGFSLAQGQFHTWTSHDNCMKPEFLEKLVDCLNRHPTWNMVYANIDIIGDDGLALANSDWYRGYQIPQGSNHIFLPLNEGMLNTYPNNYIGAGFLYRDHVSFLLGDYSKDRFTFEDYDYWMQVNSLLNLRHADFDDPLYEYRFHAKSLTSREKELKITARRDQLFIFDSFRRDFFLSPLVWIIEKSDLNENQKKKAEELENLILAIGHIILSPNRYPPDHLPRLWMPCAYVCFTENPSILPPSANRLPSGVQCIMINTAEAPLPANAPNEWDRCIHWGSHQPLPCLSGSYQGWLGVTDPQTLLAAVDVRTRTDHIRQIEREIDVQHKPGCKISVIISTYRRCSELRNAITSLAQQSLSPEDYQVIVVNNDPEDRETNQLVENIRVELFGNDDHHLKLILCPIPGLSPARNAGISESDGEYVGFFDDDATADPDWLEKIVKAFQEHPSCGVIGGTIILKPPQPQPRILKKGLEPLWGNFEPDYKVFTIVKEYYDYPWGSNWFAPRQLMVEIGGFRSQFGRIKNDFGGGEEVVAAAIINKLGFDVGIEPKAIVYHHPSADRFTLRQAWNTSLQGVLSNYRIQKNLYLSYVSNIPGNLRQILHNGLMIFNCLLPVKWQPWKALFYLLKLASNTVLLFDQIGDYFYRFRKPSVLKEPRET